MIELVILPSGSFNNVSILDKRLRHDPMSRNHDDDESIGTAYLLA